MWSNALVTVHPAKLTVAATFSRFPHTKKNHESIVSALEPDTLEEKTGIDVTVGSGKHPTVRELVSPSPVIFDSGSSPSGQDGEQPLRCHR